MGYYRLYFMNRSNGHIERFEEFDASDDSSSMAIADRHVGGQPLELWSGHRKVRRFEAVGELF
jgi:hypothetical protein